MRGFVKLRRGLAEHVRSRRMTLVEHGAYTLLLQLADHTTGCWHGTQRSFAGAAGISSGLGWKILTSLERKGYLRWNREKQSVQICKFFVEKVPEDPVEKLVETTPVSQVHGYRRDQVGHRCDHLIRNTRTPLEKSEIARSSQTLSGSLNCSVWENQSQKQNPINSEAATQIPVEVKSDSRNAVAPAASVLAEFFEEFRRLAIAKSLARDLGRSTDCRRRGISTKTRQSTRTVPDCPPP